MSSTTHGTALVHADEQLYRFPPFPAPPEDVTIVPFSAFVPAGYRRVTDPSGDAVEVDAWVGMPTVKVLNEEEASQKRKAKRRRRNAGNAMDAEGRLIPWWEEWEEGEALRAMSQTSFDSRTSFEDRVCMAADEFRVGRTWPEVALGARLMWDQFRLYIGLISSIPIYKRVKNNRKGQVDGPNNGNEASDDEGDVPRAKQTKVVVQDCLEQSALPGKQLEPTPDGSTVEARRLRAFLDDTEKTIRVFLSSYMRNTGLIWTEKNLFIAPTVLHFFLRFMLRNGVFADSTEHLDNLKRALSVAAFAQKELPLTAKLGQILPGHFDLACKECWGTKGSLSIQISATLSPADVDNTQTNGTSPPSDTSSASFETELKEHDIEVVPSTVVLDSITARQVMEDNLDTDHEVPVTMIPIAGDPWTAAIRAEEYTTASWTDVSVPWLMQLLGPTVFPLTMTTGIVESSTRRIRDVISPVAHPDGTATGNGTRKASVVEEGLAEKFFKVVMSPWVGNASEETVDFPRPVILPGSKGAVVAEVRPEGVNVGEVEHGGEDAWDPYRDDVTILVDGEVARRLLIGVGLCGIWVQMVPERGDKKHPRESCWCIESLVASFPSYYTEGETIQEVGEDED